MNRLKNFVEDNVEHRTPRDILLEAPNGIVFFTRRHDNIISV